MQKITDFIVEKRVYIFIIFLGLTIFSFFLSNKVVTNKDIIKYLPKDSNTRVGMDIMNNEFPEAKTSTLNIMFSNLSAEEKDVIYKELSNLPDVEVQYDNSNEYNKDNYTLYTLSVSSPKTSDIAKNVYDTITHNYQDYKYETSGDIAEEYAPVMPNWILALAIICALIILAIMCESFIEPFLFLIAIGMGVFLNNGTNIIFPSISSITSSISAILQLALSMDYSIMLMNRYRQEKETEPNNVLAMKKALRKSFASISSSSVTTIVGLLALVFMSFTIGRDLGLVLAKGVLFSLLTIFTCLPFLILTFDKLITKTHKKAPTLKLDGLGNLAYKHRHLGVAIFILVFAISFFMKDNLKFLYTNGEENSIDKVFSTPNEIAIVYNNKYEDKIKNYCKTLENDPLLTDVLCYSNTLNEELTYDKLNSKLADLSPDTNIEDYLLKIIYYNYYNSDANLKISLNDFLNFIEQDVYNNENLNTNITPDMKNNITKLTNFTSQNKFTKKQTSASLANLFSLKTSDIEDLFIYYNSLDTNKKLTMPKFINFMNDYVLSSKYSKDLSNDNKDNLQTLKKFTNKELLTTSLSSREMADLFDMDFDSMDSLYKYYLSKEKINLKLNIPEFASFVINEILPDETYSKKFDDQTKTSINLLATFSNRNIITSKIPASQMAQLLKLKDETVETIYSLISYTTNPQPLTIQQFVEGTLLINQQKPILSEAEIQQLESLKNIEDLSAQYLASDLAGKYKLDLNKVTLLYSLILGDKSSLVSPYDFVSFLLTNADNQLLESSLTPEIKDQLNTLMYIMSNTLNDTEYTYSALASALNLPVTSVKQIYKLYHVTFAEADISPETFVSFILEHKDEYTLASNLDEETIDELTTLNDVITNTLNDTLLSSSELANILSLNKEDTDLLYSLYDIKYDNHKITISCEEFVNFIINKVLPNSKYNSSFNQNSITKIKTISKIITNSKSNVKYKSSELYNLVKVLSSDLDQDLINILYTYYGSINNYESTYTLTITNFVNYLNDTILNDSKYQDYLDDELKTNIKDAQNKVNESKDLLVSKNYSRLILDTKYPLEGTKSFAFLDNVSKDLNLSQNKDIYLVGNTPMAHEINKTFASELNFITIITIIFIFVIVLITFKSFIIPAILVLIIQTSVYITMSIISIEGTPLYFIAILIVESILMGATIDYAILYTSYYLESRTSSDILTSIKHAYNNSIHTILTSSSILSIVTLIIGHFGSATAAKICMTISEGTICATILILVLLPAIIATFDKLIVKKVK